METDLITCLMIVEFLIALVPSVVLGRLWWKARKRVQELQGAVNLMSNAMAKVHQERDG